MGEHARISSENGSQSLCYTVYMTPCLALDVFLKRFGYAGAYRAKKEHTLLIIQPKPAHIEDVAEELPGAAGMSEFRLLNPSTRHMAPNPHSPTGE